MMKRVTLSEITGESSWIGLGIAGNQAGHLNQAGEADDFKTLAVDEHAPKGMFPWYIPQHTSFLGVDPLSSSELRHNGEACLQPEPEVGLVVKFDYHHESDELLEKMHVLGFTAMNDCSRRLAEDKISKKKNWGDRSQGMAESVYLLDDFESKEGKISNYRLASFLKREGGIHVYGKDTAVVDYTYFDEQLVNWMTHQINHQQDEGPLEELKLMFSEDKFQYGVIAIGATAYEDFGNSEEKFLRVGDEIFVLLYDSSKYGAEEIYAVMDGGGVESMRDVILLRQEVVSG